MSTKINLPNYSNRTLIKWPYSKHIHYPRLNISYFGLKVQKSQEILIIMESCTIVMNQDPLMIQTGCSSQVGSIMTILTNMREHINSQESYWTNTYLLMQIQLHNKQSQKFSVPQRPLKLFTTPLYTHISYMVCPYTAVPPKKTSTKY